MPSTRLILEPDPTPGAWNMAVDETLLESALERGTSTVRIYRWSAPTVSLGYFQDADEFEHNEQWADLAAVRRLSGGGAILHDCEITYSLTLPPFHPLTAHPSRLYAIVHDALIAVLAGFGIAARMRATPSNVNFQSSVESAPPHSALRTLHSPTSLAPLSINHQPSTINPSFLCFGRGDPNDIVLGAQKIVGSAQRRRRGAILQHGSILLERSPHAPEFPGIAELTGVKLDPAALSRQAGAAMAAALGAQAIPSDLEAAERQHARELEHGRYATLRWKTALTSAPRPDRDRITLQ